MLSPMDFHWWSKKRFWALVTWFGRMHWQHWCRGNMFWSFKKVSPSFPIIRWIRTPDIHVIPAKMVLQMWLVYHCSKMGLDFHHGLVNHGTSIFLDDLRSLRKKRLKPGSSMPAVNLERNYLVDDCRVCHFCAWQNENSQIGQGSIDWVLIHAFIK